MRAPKGWQLVGLVVSLCLLAGAVGWVAGRGRPPGRESADVAFLYDMLRHHEQAVTMAQLELGDGGGVEEAVLVFAREILLFQSHEIGLMEATLERWGHQREDPPATAMAWMGHEMGPEEMPGMATEAELDALGEAEGRDADARFVALMQDHHAGGVEMAEAAVGAVEDGYVEDLAERFARNQRAEIAELEAARERVALPVL